MYCRFRGEQDISFIWKWEDFLKERVFKMPLENGENLKGDSEERASGEAWQHKQHNRTKKVCLYKNRSVFHTVNTSGAITRYKTLPEEPEIERKLRLSVCP